MLDDGFATIPAPPTFQTSVPKLSIHTWLKWMTWLNMAAVVAVWATICIVSEEWWIGAVLTYLPRLPYAIPATLLLIATLYWSPRLAWINAAALAVVFGVIMDPRVPWPESFRTANISSSAMPPIATVRVLSCNVQGWQPDFTEILREVSLHQPEIVVFQEAKPGPNPALEKYFAKWHKVHHDYYWVGSKYPVEIIAPCEVESFERTSALLVKVELPSGPVLLADVHQMTARRGLSELMRGAVLDSASLADFAAQQAMRLEESALIRDAIEVHRGSWPVIACGDFNTPTSSSLFRKIWGDFQSAFDRCGFGYGYTSPCRKGHSIWPDETPWARIDHILTSPEWTIDRCAIGTSSGSDHRLITAHLSLHTLLDPRSLNSNRTRHRTNAKNSPATSSSISR